MKKSLLIALIVFSFAACKKEDSPAPYDGSLNGQWELNAYSHPYADDKSWKPISSIDKSTLILKADATYSYTMEPSYRSSGTFTVRDSASNIKILTLNDINFPGRYFIQQLSATEFKMDYNPGGCATGYATRKFNKTN